MKLDNTFSNSYIIALARTIRHAPQEDIQALAGQAHTRRTAQTSSPPPHSGQQHPNRNHSLRLHTQRSAVYDTRMSQLTDTHRAAIRLIVIGVRHKDAAEVHGMSYTDLSRAYRSPAGQQYAAHMRGICEQYTAALHVLGLVPSDITRPGCRYKTPQPPGSATTLRKVAAARIREGMGLPTGTQVRDDTEGSGDPGSGGFDLL